MGKKSHIGRFIKKEKCDVVYLARYYSLLALYLVLLKFRYGFKLVYTVHGLVKKEKGINKSFKFYSIWCEEFLLKHCDVIVTISSGLKQEVMKYYPKLDSSKIEVINNGVELPPIAKKIDVREKYGLDKNKSLLFTVGTRRIKNIEHILEGFVGDKEIYDNTYLLVAGEDDTEYAMALIKKYEAYANIKFIGNVDTNCINNIYEQMDAFIQISEFETFGMAIVEAMLHKKNVILSSKLPIAQYFSNGEAYYYDKEKDKLAEVIKTCLSNKSIENEKGNELVRRIFNWIL